MTKNLAAWLLLLLTLAGCLEFDAQDVTIRYDEAADRIDIHLVYRGLFAEGGNGSDRDPLAKAVKDLAVARKNGEVAFWCNWPLAFDLVRDYPAPAKALLANVDVESGGLFTDPAGVLCAHQFVRIRNAKVFLQQLNLLGGLWVQTQLAGGTNGRGGRHAWDDDTRELVAEFVRSGERFVVVEPGRVEFRLPLSPADHAWFKNQLERLLADKLPREIVQRLGVAERRAGGGDATATGVAPETVSVPGEQLPREVQRAATLRFLFDNEVAFVREPELTRFAFGVAGAKELRVVKASDGLYHQGLHDQLRASGEAIEDGVPAQELARRFDAFGRRDAVLPPAVAAARGARDAASKREDAPGKDR